MIPQRNLSLLANRTFQSQGGRRIPEAIYERDYCLAWFLIGLASNRLRDLVAFKGGTALKRMYFPDYRFSEDLDFTLTKPTSFEEILKHLATLHRDVAARSGVTFAVVPKSHVEHERGHTLFLSYVGPWPAVSQVKRVKVDVTTSERIVFDLEERGVDTNCAEYDLPDHGTLRVYSLHEIATEKIVALLDRARNEPRDLYDMWHLIDSYGLNLDEVQSAVHQKLEFRGKNLDQVRGEFVAKEKRLAQLWDSRLSAQMSHLPPFDEVYRVVQRGLRRSGLVW